MKLWDKGTAAADWVTRFTVGDDPRWDTLLLPYDAEGTRAHAWALREIGLLTEDEEAAISGVLDDVQAEAQAGRLVVTVENEDAHTVIERVLTERLGDVGKKIHAGRSRNDQVLVALRLWLRDALAAVAEEAAAVATALVAHAEAHDGLLMPGYTHTQRAMPTTAGLWAAGYAELLTDDLAGLAEARDRANVSPWGSAAGYGVPHLALPREAVARRLGFRDVQAHVTAVQLSRGKMEAAVVHALVQLAATANRLASDLVLFASAEFGFVRLPAEHTTGSSIMPQKRNPDVAELARATYHRLTAELHLLLSLPANLPSGYHRDLQLTKEAVMRAALTARDLFTALRHLLPGLAWDADRMRAALSPDLFATADALARVRAGTPFRAAYRAAAEDLDRLTVPSAEDALAAYATPGAPGNVRADLLRERLAACHRRWHEHETDEDRALNRLSAKLGLLTFIGQGLEAHIVTTFGAAHVAAPFEERRAVMDAKRKLPLGRLVRDLHDELGIEEAVVEQLRQALRVRNWLTHRFYAHYASAAFDRGVRARAHRALDEAQGILEAAQEAVRREATRLLSAAGVAEDEQERRGAEAMQETISALNAGSRVSDLWADDDWEPLDGV